MFVIRNNQNKGYYKVPSEGWTTLSNATKFPDEDKALRQRDALERKEKYFGKLTVLSEDECEENIRY